MTLKLPSVTVDDVPPHEQLFELARRAQQIVDDLAAYERAHPDRAQATSDVHLRALKVRDSVHERWARSIPPGTTDLGTRQRYEDLYTG